MCSLQEEYNEFRRGLWATQDPEECPCGGRGYVLSDFDTWHECPVHHVEGQHHPEDDCDCGQDICVRFLEADTVPAPAPVVVSDDEDELPF